MYCLQFDKLLGNQDRFLPFISYCSNFFSKIDRSTVSKALDRSIKIPKNNFYYRKNHIWSISSKRACSAE